MAQAPGRDPGSRRPQFGRLMISAGTGIGARRGHLPVARGGALETKALRYSPAQAYPPCQEVDGLSYMILMVFRRVGFAPGDQTG
jgi:hypothetical protein